jgi:hypothetical protein
MEWLLCAGKAQAEERVREAEKRVAELLTLDSHFGAPSPSARLWEAMEVLRLAREELARLKFQELAGDLRERRRPKAKSRPSDSDDEQIT